MEGGLALGFVSMLHVRDASELVATHARLVTCALSHGLLLRKLYVQDAGTPQAAFALLESLLESDGVTLVVPSLHHLWTLGHPIRIRELLHIAGHDLLTIHKPAERAC
jgi:hypothetical protein